MTGPEPVGRRAFLLGSAATAAAVLAGCSGSGDDEAARSTTRRSPTTDPAPSAADRAADAALAAWPLVTTVPSSAGADAAAVKQVLTDASVRGFHASIAACAALAALAGLIALGGLTARHAAPS